MVIKILEHTDFKFGGEDCKEDIIKIGETSLGMMRCEIIDGKVIENPPKGNKIRMENQEQEAPMNIEYFNYDILNVPYVEDLLNEIIKRLKRTYEKDQLLDLYICPRLKKSNDEDNKY